MLTLVVVLVVGLLAVGGLAAWLYVRAQAANQAPAHRPGSGLAAIARGLLTAYTGGIAAGITRQNTVADREAGIV